MKKKCSVCHRPMSDDESGDEFPEERVCDECAGIAPSDEVTKEQWKTIRGALQVTLQVASRQQYGVPDAPWLEDPQQWKERIRKVFLNIGFS